MTTYHGDITDGVWKASKGALFVELAIVRQGATAAEKARGIERRTVDDKRTDSSNKTETIAGGRRNLDGRVAPVFF